MLLASPSISRRVVAVKASNDYANTLQCELFLALLRVARDGWITRHVMNLRRYHASLPRWRWLRRYHIERQLQVAMLCEHSYLLGAQMAVNETWTPGDVWLALTTAGVKKGE